MEHLKNKTVSTFFAFFYEYDTSGKEYCLYTNRFEMLIIRNFPHFVFSCFEKSGFQSVHISRWLHINAQELKFCNKKQNKTKNHNGMTSPQKYPLILATVTYIKSKSNGRQLKYI